MSTDHTPDPLDCDYCHGTGEYFTHAEDCRDDLCALNGDLHSCAGQVVPCDCAAGRLLSETPHA